mgnify:FL=1
MAFDIDQRYRIKRSQSQEDSMRYLVNELKVFKSLSHLLVVSAVIGYNNDQHNEFEKNAEPVLMNSFSERSYDIMNFLAYAYVKEQSVLKEQKQFVHFESYAHGGFPILIDKLGIDLVDKSKNDRKTIIRKYYQLLLTKGFIK